MVVRRLSSNGSIVCLHGVTGPGVPSASSVHVSLNTLRWAVAAARQQGHIVPLAELASRHRSGQSTAGLVAFTFDDAYASLLTLAGEFLRRENVPVTVFVASDAARTGARFWWDRVEDAYATATVEQRARFERACGLPEAYVAGQPAEFGPFRPVRQWILREHRGRWPVQLEEALGSLESDVGSPTAQRSMTYEEIRQLQGLAEVDVGVHTVSHPVLPLLSAEETASEVVACHRELQEKLARVVPILAIPYGLYDARVSEIARESGMRVSLTLGETTLRNVAQADDLPRFCIMREEPRWKFHLRILGVGDRLRRGGKGVGAYPLLPSPTS